VAVHAGQPLFHQIGNGRFASPRQAGQPQDHRFLVFHRGVMVARNIGGLPMDILRAAQGEVDQPRAHGAIGHLVNQDEPAQIAVFGIGRKGYRGRW
jgi:hypothetical protein